MEMTREEMSAAGLDPESLILREVRDDAEAEAEGFAGSPTIRVDGRDLQDPGEAGTALTCRVYRRRDGRISPLPDPEDLRDALRRTAPGR